MSVTASGFFSGVGPGLLLVLSLPVALVAALKLFGPLYRFVHSGIEAFTQFIGTPETKDLPRIPGVVEALTGTNDRLDEQGQRIDRIETQLNGGGTITPALDRLERTTEQLHTMVTEAAEQARQAKLAASDAHLEAQELGVRFYEQAELSTLQRGLIETSIRETAAALKSEMDQRTEQFAGLLAEHGGPDLTVHVTPPHTHDVSPPIDQQPERGNDGHT